MIVIIDYGMGNLKSVYNALSTLNLPCKISSDISDIKNAEKLILPGVGAFNEAMDNLCNYRLIDAIKDKVNNGCPLLGICLGMQMLFEEGYEGEIRNGLGFIKGKIKRIEPKKYVKLPHIGWNRLETNNYNNILYGVSEENFVYYVHSFMARDMEDVNLVAYSEYGGVKIPGLVNKDNIYGAQFHPEKSGEIGLKILRNFGEMI
ncbi:imidazole glycerol phosphate synthase subunit HisH [Clostridium celatum]|uniref:Imidazole glycerol phosphate synthase subunit HisH n=1 Tax=Clostridium celatum DSM 1785 TaxID=545697 RepID=L1QBN1_9CLOT|nr:imidazole glycerol phosphate synthase subunit HisH [Clostridium celatum]EKY25100.1 imidazole glycerol phosphate synthase, glutamine amidotransferase subunit [Clostridium celatum DSM 1785]MCE9655940.1 imidazole glycerol phosphate synthase subunit HisH [Clostridium celatum]MDU3722623.1 imidazole glycerol phosphate synthase subunit HisH [Clostridium celatum]MDU6294869.1 imidazole glycerol phosphate synthase subunit HisH [Clostridium celatum]